MSTMSSTCPILGALGKAAVQFETDVMTYHSEHYVQGNYRITVFRPVMEARAACVVVTEPKQRWFSNRPDTGSGSLPEVQTCEQEFVDRQISERLWIPTDPWREAKNEWLGLSEYFAQPSDLVKSRVNDLFIVSGASCTGKTYICRRLGCVAPGTSRGARDDERKWNKPRVLARSELIPFGTANTSTSDDDTGDALLFLQTMFEMKAAMCYFLSPRTLDWHFVLTEVINEAFEDLQTGRIGHLIGHRRKLFLPGGLDMAVLMKGCFACLPESTKRPTIIYNMPADLDQLDEWYEKRGLDLSSKETRLTYDKCNAEESITKADFVNVLVRGSRKKFLNRVKLIAFGGRVFARLRSFKEVDMEMKCIKCNGRVSEIVENNEIFFLCLDCGGKSGQALELSGRIVRKKHHDGREKHVSVGAIIKRGRKYLIAKRRVFEFGYGNIAGHVEYGETADEAIKREVFEETGMKITNLERFFHEDVDGDRCKSGADIHEYYYYLVTCEGEPVKNNEASELNWYSPKELKELNLVYITRYIYSHLGVI